MKNGLKICDASNYCKDNGCYHRTPHVHYPGSRICASCYPLPTIRRGETFTCISASDGVCLKCGGDLDMVDGCSKCGGKK